MKRFFWIALIFCIVFITVANLLVETKASDTFNSIEELPNRKVGLLLGTSKFLRNNQQNLYYKHRIEAATDLFESGKVQYILISGDNATRYYDEPTTMKTDLLAAGVPAEKIILDYAGFRTLDSVVRSKAVFGEDSITVISQQFHNERALYIAGHIGINAVGYNAKSVSSSYGFKTQVREVLARTKMLLDLIFGVEPKFYGDKIEIGDEPTK
ncbi:SanA/YdcF family protein [Halocola ammonii]